MNYTQPLVSFLSALTLGSQIFLAIIIACLLLGKGKGVLSWLQRNALTLMLIVAATATAGSLFFSEIAGWTPCRLCWYQRIFMYPQAAILALALWKRDRGIAPYILLLSAIGIVIAGFHYGEQVMAALYPEVVDPNTPCDTTGTSCARTPFFHYGYITIPMMALTAFALNIAGSLLMRRGARA